MHMWYQRMTTSGRHAAAGQTCPRRWLSSRRGAHTSCKLEISRHLLLGLLPPSSRPSTSSVLFSIADAQLCLRNQPPGANSAAGVGGGEYFLGTRNTGTRRVANWLSTSAELFYLAFSSSKLETPPLSHDRRSTCRHRNPKARRCTLASAWCTSAARRLRVFKRV